MKKLISFKNKSDYTSSSATIRKILARYAYKRYIRTCWKLYSKIIRIKMKKGLSLYQHLVLMVIERDN